MSRHKMRNKIRKKNNVIKSPRNLRALKNKFKKLHNQRRISFKIRRSIWKIKNIKNKPIPVYYPKAFQKRLKMTTLEKYYHLNLSKGKTRYLIFYKYKNKLFFFIY